jgi:hypothetical protein
VSADEVVKGTVQGDGVLVVDDPLAKGIREPRKQPLRHPQGQILPFNVARRDVLRARNADLPLLSGTVALAGAVLALWRALAAIGAVSLAMDDLALPPATRGLWFN